MKKLYAGLVLMLSLLSLSVQAEPQKVVVEGVYYAGKSDSQDVAQKMALERAMQLAAQRVSTFIQVNEHIVNGVKEQEIFTVSGSVMSVNVLEQKLGTHDDGFYATAKIEAVVDPVDMEAALKKMREDKGYRKQIEALTKVNASLQRDLLRLTSSINRDGLTPEHRAQLVEARLELLKLIDTNRENVLKGDRLKAMLEVEKNEWREAQLLAKEFLAELNRGRVEILDIELTTGGVDGDERELVVYYAYEINDAAKEILKQQGFRDDGDSYWGARDTKFFKAIKNIYLGATVKWVDQNDIEWRKPDKETLELFVSSSNGDIDIKKEWRHSFSARPKKKGTNYTVGEIIIEFRNDGEKYR